MICRKRGLPCIAQHAADDGRVRGVPVVVTHSAPRVEGVYLHAALVRRVAAHQPDGGGTGGRRGQLGLRRRAGSGAADRRCNKMVPQLTNDYDCFTCFCFGYIQYKLDMLVYMLDNTSFAASYAKVYTSILERVHCCF